MYYFVSSVSRDYEVAIYQVYHLLLKGGGVPLYQLDEFFDV